MKRFYSLLFVSAAMVALLAGAPPRVDAAKYTIKFALSVPDSPLKQPQGAKAFKNYVEFRSNGEIEVKLFFAQFGGERELAEQVQQGTLDMSVVSDGAMAGFYKDMQVFSIPYLFPSSPVAWKFFDHPFAKQLADGMRQKTGLRTLTFAENGFRNFTNNVREIKTPSDMRGMKIRTMQAPVYMRFVQSLGAAATPISFAELIMSLQQGVVDGQENATQDIYENGMADVQKFLSIDEHIFSLHMLIINDKFFSGLPEPLKHVVADGAKVYESLADGLQTRSHNEYVDKIKAKGVKVYVNSPQEKELFRKASQEPVKKFIAEQVGQDLLNKVLNAVEESQKAAYSF
jgi:TRAP-type transport system periplasmic protein